MLPLPALASIVDEVKAAPAAPKAGEPAQHLASISAKSKSINLVAKVTVTAPSNDNGDVIEFIWLKDANTGEILAASKGAKTLVTSIDKGKRVIPVIKYAADGTWDGAAVDLVPGFSSIL